MGAARCGARHDRSQKHIQVSDILPMKTLHPLKQALLIAVTGGAIGLSSIVLARENHYFVYCANDKIEIAMSNLEQMKSARGSDVFQLGAFHYLSDAQDYARRFGGEGASCAKK
jgi:hypothetical protein